jgi:RHS repeat-associated protein
MAASANLTASLRPAQHRFGSGGFAGITTTNSYNNRLQPAVLSASAPSGAVLSFSYNFDQDSGAGVKNNGNVVQIANNRDTTRTQNFTYDELNRIKTAKTPTVCGQCTPPPIYWGQSFTYDIWANLLTTTVTQGSAPTLSVTVGTDNRINTAGFTYDSAGNMTNSGSGVMTYDAENRLVTVAGVTHTGACPERSRRNGDGKRVKKSNGKLYWTGTGADALAETDLAGVIQSELTFFGGKRVARRDGSGNTVFYYFSDHLGSASVVTNATGTIVEESDYYPFGGERVITNSDPNQYKFTGKERDGESGLDYFGARYLSANLGRFATPDPVHFQAEMLSDPQRFNLYGYVRNNPLFFVDPKGEAIELTGTAEERKKLLDAIKNAVGDEAGKYLYENAVTDTDGNTSYFVGVYTNGPDGSGPSFSQVNEVAGEFSAIIGESRIYQMQLVQPGETVNANGISVRLGAMGQEGSSGLGPGVTWLGRDNKVHVAIMDWTKASLGTLPRQLMSDGPGFVDPGMLTGHEFGHGRAQSTCLGCKNPDPNGNSALRLENKVQPSRSKRQH